MKITIIHTDPKHPSPEVQQLKYEANRLKIDCEITDLDIKKDLKPQVQTFGDIIIWRMKKLPLRDIVNRKILLDLLSNKKIFNFCIDKAWSSNKYSQQHHIEKNSNIPGIPTYKFHTKKELLKAINDKILNFPIVQKPAIGCKGENVSLVKNEKDIVPSAEMHVYVYQNFIPNDGDYRVIVLGGKVLGCIKREANKKDFRNNISQGARAVAVTNTHILKKINKLALEISSAFNLLFCGIDIIYDTQENTFRFLEINSLPEWQGFQKITKVNVAKEVLRYCDELNKRKKQKISLLVENYFHKNKKYIDLRIKFHFYSRLFLWTNEKKYLAELNHLKKYYLGEKQSEILQNIENKVEEYKTEKIAKGPIAILRKKYFEKYPELCVFKDLLFPLCFAKTIYNQDISYAYKNYIKEISTLYKRLAKDKKAIAFLSTHAINFFYLTDLVLGKKITKHSYISSTPHFFLNIAKKYYKNSNINHSTLKLYLLGHCIINESNFYKKNITKNKKVYLDMLKEMEKSINKNYFNLSLDNKLEFLVCTRLLLYKSHLESVILHEAENSLSEHGNYIIDKLNSKKSLIKDNIYYAEHRNVLYLMLKQKRYLTKKDINHA